MPVFEFGVPEQLDDHSFAWPLLLCSSSNTDTYVFSDSIWYDKYQWYVNLLQIDSPDTEYKIRCTACDDKDQTLQVSQLYKLSIVDDGGRELWSSKTEQGLFNKHLKFFTDGEWFLVHERIMTKVNNLAEAKKKCLVKLDFITEEETKREAADSERATGPQLEYEGTGALLEAVKELLLDEEDFDVTFSVQGKEFKAHKIFLKARSPVFKRMFAHDMLEKKSGRVEIEDCDPDVFALFHRFLYTGKADGLTEKNVAPLYHFADKYDVPSLCKICVLFIKNNFDVEEFGDFAEIACLSKEAEEDLFAAAVQFFAKNLEEIADTAKWKAFMRENSEGASELIKAFNRLR